MKIEKIDEIIFKNGIQRINNWKNGVFLATQPRFARRTRWSKREHDHLKDKNTEKKTGKLRSRIGKPKCISRGAQRGDRSIFAGEQGKRSR
jgi:hypothetical protein